VPNKLIEKDRNLYSEIVGAIDIPIGPDYPNPIEPDKPVPNNITKRNPTL